MPDVPSLTSTINSTCNGHAVSGSATGTEIKAVAADAYDAFGNDLELKGCHDRAVAAHALATQIRSLP
jgi:hypothetical protein